MNLGENNMQTIQKSDSTFRDSMQAFNDAIKTGRLSDDSTSDRYAGRYMYMGTVNGKDLFKDIDDRKYID
jgi:hypothetical protein